MNKIELINSLIDIFGYKSYVEIGLSDPKNNYIHIKCENKYSIDPYFIDEYTLEPLYDRIPDYAQGYITHHMTSDEFFKYNNDKYDIFFIDGLHTEEQVQKDIINALKHLNYGGKIVVHDCLPDKEEYTIDTNDRKNDMPWYGTVWKAITTLGQQDITYYTIDIDCGCCVISYKENSEDLKIPEKCTLTWEDYKNNKVNYLNVVTARSYFFTIGKYLFDGISGIHFFDVDYSDRNKYMVICVAKLENGHIREWVEHYLNLNFDKIIIGDNNDDDSLSEILKDYVDNGSVEIFNLHGFKRFQEDFYDMFTRIGNYKWAAYYDCDEYLEIPAYDDIKEFLRNNDYTDCMLFHWITMSNNGDICKKSENFKDRFKIPVKPINMFAENFFYKSMLRGGNRRFFFNGTPHTPMGEIGDVYTIGNHGRYEYETIDNQNLSFKDGYIKHYSMTSAEECIEKHKRGYPDDIPETDKPDFMYKNGINTYMSLKEYSDSYRFQPFKTIDSLKDEIEKYKYIYITTWKYKTSIQVINEFVWLLMNFENKTFVFDYGINDSIYNIVLNFSLETTNRVACCDSYEEFTTSCGRSEEDVLKIEML